MGLLQTKKLPCSKGNRHQNEKATDWMGDDICKRPVGLGVESKTYKEFVQLDNRKTNHLIKKRAEDLSIFPKTYRWPAGTRTDAQH